MHKLAHEKVWILLGQILNNFYVEINFMDLVSYTAHHIAIITKSYLRISFNFHYFLLSKSCMKPSHCEIDPYKQLISKKLLKIIKYDFTFYRKQFFEIVWPIQLKASHNEQAQKKKLMFFPKTFLSMGLACTLPTSRKKIVQRYNFQRAQSIYLDLLFLKFLSEKKN